MDGANVGIVATCFGGMLYERFVGDEQVRSRETTGESEMQGSLRLRCSVEMTGWARVAHRQQQVSFEKDNRAGKKKERKVVR